jgi:hypothetical protein
MSAPPCEIISKRLILLSSSIGTALALRLLSPATWVVLAFDSMKASIGLLLR